ncbi:MAG: hypothetical protein ACI4PF_01760 [Christensenellales bacterium]
MNERLLEIFNRFRHLKTMQVIVEEIVALDYYVYNYVEQEAIKLIDFCITKYGEYIKRIGSLYQDRVVVENDPQLYEQKDEVEINSDVQFIRDCLIIIGAVQSGIRPNIESVVREIKEG